MRTVDLFCGWGGFSLGAEVAGADIVWAANHAPIAVQAHKLNHPGTHHECQDLNQADWHSLPSFDLMLASPACQGHSNASQPKRRRYHDASRNTAFGIIEAVEVTRPRAVIVENVPEFRTNYSLYRMWRMCFEELGYSVSEHLLTASHYGVPQRRKRLFIIATQRPHKLSFRPSKREPAFGPCIDWKAGKWRPVRDAGRGAQLRIAAGRKRHGRRFITQHVTGHKGVALSEPLRTITKQDQWAIVDGESYRPLTVRETARGMGFPDDYRWPEGSTRRAMIEGLGNAVCPPVATKVVRAVMEAM